MYTHRQQEHKRAKREAVKEEKQKAREDKRAAIDNLLASMTEEERTQWHKNNKVISQLLIHSICMCAVQQELHARLHASTCMVQVC